MPLHESLITRNIAEAHAAEADAEKSHAERAFFLAQARGEKAEAQIAEISLRAEQRKERRELAQDTHHNVYVFDQQVEEASVKACIQQLTIWSRQDPQCKIELQINSPGGSIFDGFALVDSLRRLRDNGHHITTVALGMAASMGGVVLQAGDTRVIGANALMLIHEGSLGAIGDFGHVEDRVKLMELMHDRILSLLEERALPINPKTTKAFIKKNWQRKDWWLSAQDCAKLGFVDEVR